MAQDFKTFDVGVDSGSLESEFGIVTSTSFHQLPNKDGLDMLRLRLAASFVLYMFRRAADASHAIQGLSTVKAYGKHEDHVRKACTGAEVKYNDGGVRESTEQADCHGCRESRFIQS